MKGKIIIHGHTPKSCDFIRAQQWKNSINIDGGCVYTTRKDYGNLVALDIAEKKLIFVKNIDN